MVAKGAGEVEKGKLDLVEEHSREKLQDLIRGHIGGHHEFRITRHYSSPRGG